MGVITDEAGCAITDCGSGQLDRHASFNDFDSRGLGCDVLDRHAPLNGDAIASCVEVDRDDHRHDHLCRPCGSCC